MARAGAGVSIPPDRTLEQRRQALAKANEVRTARRDLKVELAAGLGDPAAIVEVPPLAFESMRVRDLLLALPGVGRRTADKMLWRARVAPTKTLVGLSDRQRHELVVGLRARRRSGWIREAAA